MIWYYFCALFVHIVFVYHPHYLDKVLYLSFSIYFKGILWQLNKKGECTMMTSTISGSATKRLIQIQSALLAQSQMDVRAGWNEQDISSGLTRAGWNEQDISSELTRAGWNEQDISS